MCWPFLLVGDGFNWHWRKKYSSLWLFGEVASNPNHVKRSLNLSLISSNISIFPILIQTPDICGRYNGIDALTKILNVTYSLISFDLCVIHSVTNDRWAWEALHTKCYFCKSAEAVSEVFGKCAWIIPVEYWVPVFKFGWGCFERIFHAEFSV